MKNSKLLPILALALLLAGCKNSEGVSENEQTTIATYSETSKATVTTKETEASKTTTTSAITKEETKETSATTAKPAEETTEASADITTTQTTTSIVESVTEETVVTAAEIVTTKATERTTATKESVVSSEEKAETSDITSESAETTAAPESEKEKYTIFKDSRTKKKFMVLNLTAEKVYWNEAEDYSISEGETVDIAVPVIFADWFTDTDDVMLYLGERFQKISVMDCGDMTVRGIAYTDYWSMDNICLINDGIVHFGEYTEEMKNAFRRIDSGYFIDEANYYYPDFPLEDGMTVENLDLYFETMKTDRDVLYEKIANNPDTDYDIAGFWGWIDGIRLRGKVNFIY